MHRVDTNGNVANRFDPGDPLVPRLPTQIDEHILNAFQEELANAIESDGTALVKDEWFQLRGVLAQLLPAPGGRLTLTSGAPATANEQAGATTVYYSPYKHARIAVYDGTRWHFYSFAEMSQALTDATKSPAAAVASSNYDVFVWMDGSTLRATRGPLWTSDTARGSGAGTTELEFFGSRWVNKNAITNGPAVRCGTYVGTIRTDGSAHANDTSTLRHVWNAHNRISKAMRAVDATASWNYSTASFRQANGSAANQLDMVRGLDEDAVSALVAAQVESVSASVSGFVAVGIGLDSTAANAANTISPFMGLVQNVVAFGHASWNGYPGLGRHYLAWLEYGVAGGYTSTWYGTPSNTTGGIQAQIMA